MPVLKQLTCHVEWTGSNLPLQEFGTAYSDGFVHTYVPIPSVSTAFSIHLTSKGYIAPGLAMFVYMDGAYQCNRNQHGLKLPSETLNGSACEIDFRVRQKEQKTDDGTWLGEEWRFEKLDTVVQSSSTAMELQAGEFDHIGTIEVVVLRCQANAGSTTKSMPTRTRKSTTTKDTSDRASQHPLKKQQKKPLPSNSKDQKSVRPPSPAFEGFGGIFDGGNDAQDHIFKKVRFGSDGNWDERSGPGAQGAGSQSGVMRTGPGSDRAQTWTGGSVQRPGPTGWGASGESIHVQHGQPHDWVPPPSSGPNQCTNFQSVMPPSPAVLIQVGSGVYRPANPIGARNDNANGNPLAQPQAAPTATGSWVYHQSGGPPGRVDSTRTVYASEGGNHRRGTSVAPSETPLSQQGPFGLGIAGFGNVNPSQGAPRWGNQIPKDGSSGGHNMHSSWDGKTYPGYVQGHESRAWDASGENWERQSFRNSNGNKESPHRSHKDIQWSGATEAYQRQPRGNGHYRSTSNNSWDHNRVPGGDKKSDWNSLSWQSGGNLTGQSFTHSNEPEANRGHWQASQSPVAQAEGQWQASDAMPHNQAVLADWTTEKDTRAQWGHARSDVHNGGHAGDQSQSKVDKDPGFASNEAPIWTTEATHEEPPSHSHEATSASAWIQPPDMETNVQGDTAWGQSLHSKPASPRPRSVTQQEFSVKAHWSNWKKEARIKATQSRGAAQKRSEGAYIADEKPLSAVPEEVIREKLASHQVQPGRPASYLHKQHRPVYIDTTDSPYAVFVFKYRSKEVLHDILNVTIADDPAEERSRLQSLSKDHLIEELLKRSNPHTGTASVANGGNPGPAEAFPVGEFKSQDEWAGARRNTSSVDPWARDEKKQSSHKDWPGDNGNEGQEGGVGSGRNTTGPPEDTHQPSLNW